MRQFFINNDSAFRDLEERAKRACIRFRNMEMPPSCNPNRADVGFEVHNDSGMALLYVGKGIHYSGGNPTVREWFLTGVKRFCSFTHLKAWIQGPLKQEFNIPSVLTDIHLNDNSLQLTDITEVYKELQKVGCAPCLNEDELFRRLNQRIIGQDDALRSLASTLVYHLAKKQPRHPAVLFCVGPSGVGKTYTAEVTAQVLRELIDGTNGYQFLRLDMTEYQEPHRVSQLLGAPQGYIGYGEGSQLMDALQSNPCNIVLFDEIEKAHPSILKSLMNAMDTGRLSTTSRLSSGREIDCRRAIFIFTSNIDAKGILDEMETRKAFGNRAIEDEVCRRRLHAAGIAPEIVGRIGRFLIYRPLSIEDRVKIMALSIADVAEEFGLKIGYIQPEVITYLMQKLHSQDFGIRPARFLIDDVIGGAFVKVVKERVTVPIKVVGPPIECKLFVNGEDIAQEGRRTKHRGKDN